MRQHTRHALIVLLASAPGLGCASNQPTPEPSNEPAPSTEPTPPAPTGLEARVAELVADHLEVDPRWLEAASVVAVGRLETGSYPCIFHEDGSSDMPASHTFEVEEVLLAGSLARPTIDLAPPYEPSLDWPGEVRDGARYLLFLAPSESSQALLADENEHFGVYTQLGQSEIVAMVDLGATPEELAERRGAVERHGEMEAYELDDERWKALRKTPGVSPEELMSALFALRNDRFAQWQTRDDVIAALGPPDRTRKEKGEVIDTYFVNAADAEHPSETTFVAQIELTSARGELFDYAEDFLIGREGKLELASYEAKKDAGLMWTQIQRRR